MVAGGLRIAGQAQGCGDGLHRAEIAMGEEKEECEGSRALRRRSKPIRRGRRRGRVGGLEGQDGWK